MSKVKMPNFFPTRPQYRKMYPFSDMVNDRGDGTVEIVNPTIKSIRRGQCVRVWKGNGRDTWGMVVEKVNTDTNEVLVRTNMGYPTEFNEWVDVNMVQRVWGTMTYEEVLKLCNAFATAVHKILDEQEKVLNGL